MTRVAVRGFIRGVRACYVFGGFIEDERGRTVRCSVDIDRRERSGFVCGCGGYAQCDWFRRRDEPMERKKRAGARAVGAVWKCLDVVARTRCADTEHVVGRNHKR